MEILLMLKQTLWDLQNQKHKREESLKVLIT